MSQFVAKNPPWVRAGAGLVQSGAAGSSSHLLAAQQVGHANATNASLTSSAAGLAAGAANPLAQAAAVVAAAQNQQVQQGPTASVSYGTGLAAITLTQSALQQSAMLQQQGLTIPASLAGTSQVANVNNGMMVEIARLPQPGVALPTSLATTQVATVSYPAPRLLAQATQYQAPVVQPAAVMQQVQQQPPQPQYKNRVFTGTVTKLHNNFGFVDDDVFFQLSAVKGNMPKVGERVLAEASYDVKMPFKWNASRIQVLPNQVMQINVQQNNNNRTLGQQVAAVVATPAALGINVSQGVNMNAAIASIASNQAAFTASVNAASQRWQVQPELTVIETLGQRINMPHSNQHQWVQEVEFGEMGSRVSTIGRRHNSPPPMRRDRERERDNRREDRRDRHRSERDRYSPPPRKRSRSPRRTSRSPPRRRMPRAADSKARYTVQIPKISLDLKTGNVMELKKRYSNLYIPSDFCAASFLWQDAFPPHRHFSIDHACEFHLISKDADPILDVEPIPDPSDADYTFSAKVMLLSVPPLANIFQKACALAQDSDDSKESFVHPTRLINFLVGLKGKNETMAIGGPWSPSLDGPDPEGDPGVLVKTAIRTCRSLTGVDLSKCSQWYRFAEICYRRADSHKSRGTRVETVVFFVPDVWSCLPTRSEWEAIVATGTCKKSQKQPEEIASDHEAQEEEALIADNVEKKEPTHHSQLDPKTIKVSDLKKELEARNLSIKGLKSQLIARLTKALKMESEKENEEKNAEMEKMEFEVIDEATDDDKKKEDEKGGREKDSKKFPESPVVLVQPSRTAKNGKFDCALMSLSLLLDYRPEDNKEHSFEVSLFAELFNEMMMRDFGFRIYRSLVESPEVKDDEKDKKKTDKKDEKKDKKDEKDDCRRKDEGNENDSDRDEDGSDDDDNDDDKKDRRKRRKKRPQMVTQDPFLLLSFVYYDQAHSGYLLDKDIEELLHTLGLMLSRAQIKKLVQKVCKRDMLRYRRLTDFPMDAEKLAKPDALNLEDLAAGNKKYIPSLKSSLNISIKSSDETAKPSEVSLVTHQGALVDIGKLMEQLERSERARLENDAKLNALQLQLDAFQEEASAKDKASQKVSNELDESKHRVTRTEEDLKRSRAEADRYHRALCGLKESLQSALFTTDAALQQRQRAAERMFRLAKEEETNGIDDCNSLLMGVKTENET